MSGQRILDPDRGLTYRRLTAWRSDASDGRGAGTVLIVGILAAIVALTAALVLVGQYLVADGQANVAADQAAWAGAVAYGQGRDACSAAKVAAKQHRADLTTCSVAGDEVDFVVTVRVTARVGHKLRGLPDRLPATAHAGRVS